MKSKETTRAVEGQLRIWTNFSKKGRRMISIQTICLSFYFGVLGVSWGGEAGIILLDEYISQVKSVGPAYCAAQNAAAGLAKQKVQTDLFYSPQLVAHAARLDDRSEQIMPSFYGEKTVADDYGVALVKKWKYGATTSFDYAWTRTKVDGSSVLPEGNSYQVHPSASISIPLWRDFLGRQTRAQMDHNRLLIQSAEYGAAHQREGIIYQSRNAYWRLQLARKAVDIRKDTLKRAETLVTWSKRRVDLKLADSSEVLQARAGQEVRALELDQALESERAARIAFNRFRGVESDAVTEVLGDLEIQMAGCVFSWPEQAPRRWDMRSVDSKVASDKAAWKDAKSNASPDLNVFASVTSNGLDSAFDSAHRESTKGHHPTSKVGAQIVVPLDVFTARKAAKGYELNFRASQGVLRDKELEVKQEWAQLRNRLTDVNRRLEMVSSIESIQKQKAEKERQQLSIGRSTQFQVQSYEIDYSVSRLQRLATIAEKLSIWAEGEWMLSAEKETEKQNTSTEKFEVKP